MVFVPPSFKGNRKILVRGTLLGGRSRTTRNDGASAKIFRNRDIAAGGSRTAPTRKNDLPFGKRLAVRSTTPSDRHFGAVEFGEGEAGVVLVVEMRLILQQIDR